MAEVGRLAGVSQVTVSRALSDPSKVSPATRDRVRKAIEATGFVPNAVAGSLASARSGLVSAIIPSLTNITYTALVREFSNTLKEAGYQVLLSECGHDPALEEEIVERHLSRRPDAILLTGVNHGPRTRRMLLGAGIPVMEWWDMSDSPVDMCVGFSHGDCGAAAASFAKEHGYRRAACILADDPRARRRADGFARAFAGTVPQIVVEGEASIAAGRKGLAQLLERDAAPVGLVFCSSDLIAHGSLIEARVRGLRIPEDVALLGFGDQDFAAYLDPPLSSIRIDRSRMGRLAAKALIGRMEGDDPTQPVADLGFEVIRRASC
jgi:LacI family gluconate utilization system Gnt-I transcriptional repressor